MQILLYHSLPVSSRYLPKYHLVLYCSVVKFYTPNTMDQFMNFRVDWVILNRKKLGNGVLTPRFPMRQICAFRLLRRDCALCFSIINWSWNICQTTRFLTIQKKHWPKYHKFNFFRFWGRIPRDLDFVECRGYCQKVGPQFFYHNFKLEHL